MFCLVWLTASHFTTSPPRPVGARVRLTTVHCCQAESRRSTAREVEEEKFSEGAGSRASRLQAALRDLGFEEIYELTQPNDFFRGSPALRTYLSFVYPKSKGALANAEKPGRLLTVAQSICFLAREQRADQTAWLRNHDRALTELSARGGARHQLHLVLDNVRSAANVGNLYRAAEAACIERIWSCGITPRPPCAKLLKTAMGAAEYVPHVHVASTLQAVKTLQAQGVRVWAVETTSKSVALHDALLPCPVALVLGNELIGVDTQVLGICDGCVQIPMYGMKNSLNVATAGSILMWETLRQWRNSEGTSEGYS